MADANCTINIPGLWHNGDCDLLCRETQWYDILIFFLGNYVAHVATVPSRPYYGVFHRTMLTISALLFPVAGVSLGFEAIVRRAILAPTSLQTAARAGALLMVVSQDQDSGLARISSKRNSAVDDIELVAEEAEPLRERPPWSSRETLVKRKRPWMTYQIHGGCLLPDGYALLPVPWDAEFENDVGHRQPTWWRRCTQGLRLDNKPPVEVASNYNIVKLLISIAQLVFGCVTLYRTRGNQIERYGYAAFGLTVTPYVWMSFVNLMGNILQPDYPCMYLVGSKQTDYLRQQYPHPEHKFTTTGHLTDDCAAKVQYHFDHPTGRRSLQMSLNPAQPWSWKENKHIRNLNAFRGYIEQLIGISVPILIYGVLSRFTYGHSTTAQRGWTMSWLVIGATMNVFSAVFISWPRESISDWIMNAYLMVICAAYAVPAVGGFVTVAQMMTQYGTCSRVLGGLE